MASDTARDSAGRFVGGAPGVAALARFLAKIRFDPQTGCVNWIAAVTSAQGKNAQYGYFWYEGRAMLAHRWAAKYIHGLDIEGQDVDHECCNTLCQHHLQAVAPIVNRELQWIRVQVGLQEIPEKAETNDVLSVPANWSGQFPEPLWLREARNPSLISTRFERLAGAGGVDCASSPRRELCVIVGDSALISSVRTNRWRTRSVRIAIRFGDSGSGFPS